MKINMSKVVILVMGVFIALVVGKAWQSYRVYFEENKVLKQVIHRLEADSRIAEVLVTDVQFNPLTQKHTTTIKFLEYDTSGDPLAPRYFSFSGNIIQFQSLVVRFDDMHIKAGDGLKGKSLFLFWKAFFLDGKETEEFAITEVNSIPQGYRIDGDYSEYEKRIWSSFWELALNDHKAVSRGIKNAQIEAPGTKFVPGVLYTLKIEHDGGIRIDSSPIPGILKGEKL